MFPDGGFAAEKLLVGKLVEGPNGRDSAVALGFDGSPVLGDSKVGNGDLGVSAMLTRSVGGEGSFNSEGLIGVTSRVFGATSRMADWIDEDGVLSVDRSDGLLPMSSCAGVCPAMGLPGRLTNGSVVDAIGRLGL